MKVSVDDGDLGRRSFDWVAVLVLEGRNRKPPRLSAPASELDRALSEAPCGSLSRAGASAAEQGEALAIFRHGQPTTLVQAATRPARGRGARAPSSDPETLRQAAGTIARKTTVQGGQHVALLLPTLRAARQEAFAQALAEGLVLGNYRFDGHFAAAMPTRPVRCARRR